MSPQFDEEQNHEWRYHALKKHESDKDLRVRPVEILAALIMDRETIAMEEADKANLFLDLLIGRKILRIDGIWDSRKSLPHIKSKLLEHTEK